MQFWVYFVTGFVIAAGIGLLTWAFVNEAKRILSAIDRGTDGGFDF